METDSANRNGRSKLDRASRRNSLAGRGGAPATGALAPAAKVVGRGWVASAVVAVPMSDLKAKEGQHAPGLQTKLDAGVPAKEDDLQRCHRLSSDTSTRCSAGSSGSGRGSSWCPPRRAGGHSLTSDQMRCRDCAQFSRGDTGESEGSRSGQQRFAEDHRV